MKLTEIFVEKRTLVLSPCPSNCTFCPWDEYFADLFLLKTYFRQIFFVAIGKHEIRYLDVMSEWRHDVLCFVFYQKIVEAFHNYVSHNTMILGLSYGTPAIFNRWVCNINQ